MKTMKLALLTGLLFSTSTLFAADDISGVWRSIDDKTGFSKALIEIKKDGKGVYTGKIIKILPRPGYTPKTHCQDCPAPYKNAPILGLTVLDGMKQSKKSTEYEGGTILDPLSGKVYKSKIKVSSNGNRLRMRGYVGVEVFGRSQTWIRDQ